MTLEVVQFASGVVSLIAGIAVIYVSMRLAQFETKFLEKIEERFVSKAVFDVETENWGREMERIYRKVFNGEQK